MDIRHLAWRNHGPAAQNGIAPAVQPAVAKTEGESAQAATSAAADGAAQPAARSHFSRAGRLLNVLQAFEQRHPDETKAILNNIADKLRSDAEQAGPFGSRLTKWADRFQEAADTGDMSKLMPRLNTAGHFGMRAYQQAQAATETESETEAMVAQVADAALTQSSNAVVSSANPSATVSDESEKPERVETASEVRPALQTTAEAAAAAGSASDAQAPGSPTTDPSSMSSDIAGRV